MKLFKLLVLTLSLSATISHAQEIPVEDLPVATINENFYVTLPETPIASDYYIDIEHLDFEDALDAETQIRGWLTANLITPTLHYDENYIILHVHTEFMGESPDLAEFQTYLSQLSRPE